MKISILPYIVQRLVLDHMSINNIFFLSLCSKNTKNFIIQTQKYQFEKVERVNYLVNGKKTTTINMKLATSVLLHKLLLLVRTPAGFSEEVTGGRDRDSVEKVRVNELGISIDFYRSPTNQTNLHAKYTSDNLETIIERVHDHLYDLFGRHTKFWLLCIPKPKAHFLPKLRDIQVLDIWIGAFAATTIEEYLSRTPSLEFFSYNSQHGRAVEFKKCSRVYKLDTLEVVAGRRMAKDAMKYFDGRHAFLDSVCISTNDAIQFLNAWKLGEKFRNLEVITIAGRIQVSDIRRSVEFEKLDKTVKYSFVRKYEKPGPPERSEFETRSYLVRESDGRVASVLLERGRVFLGVWNTTEAEFLQKFQ